MANDDAQYDVPELGREMKIPVICQPDEPGPDPMEDGCEDPVRRGHPVHVVTGARNGRLYSSYIHCESRFR